jgi:hypothetical protein
MQIPPSYRAHIDPIIAKAKGFLENGEALTPIAFVGSFTTNTVIPVMLDSTDIDSKERSASTIAAAALQANADYVFTVIEAWGMPKKYMNRVEEIYEKYGSLANFPHRLDVASFMLETRHGLWMAQCTILPKPPSKKRRTIMPPEFVFGDKAQGRFANLLPVKEEHVPGSGLH